MMGGIDECGTISQWSRNSWSSISFLHGLNEAFCIRFLHCFWIKEDLIIWRVKIKGAKSVADDVVKHDIIKFIDFVKSIDHLIGKLSWRWNLWEGSSRTKSLTKQKSVKSDTSFGRDLDHVTWAFSEQVAFCASSRKRVNGKVLLHASWFLVGESTERKETPRVRVNWSH